MKYAKNIFLFCMCTALIFALPACESKKTETILDSSVMHEVITSSEPESITTVNEPVIDNGPVRDRETFMEECGFTGSIPDYKYYDEQGKLQLELYYDLEKRVAGGIRYNTIDQTMYGFWADDIYSAPWKDADPFLLTSVNGEDGSASVNNYKEFSEDNELGQLSHAWSVGEIDWLKDAEPPEYIVALRFLYREDGSLFKRIYQHNPYIFSSTLSTVESYYDTNERVLYSESYITHGILEEYYIYQNEGKIPSYILVLDEMGGNYHPVFYVVDKYTNISESSE